MGLVAVVGLVGCGGDSAAQNNALPTVQKSEGATSTVSTEKKEPTKKGGVGTNNLQGEPARGAID